MQEKLYQMLMDEDEITWKSIIYELVKSEEMNPWDINISLLTKKYLEAIKQLQEHNFFISGKVVLAASILLKIKSTKLLDENIADFDSLLFSADEEDLLLEEQASKKQTEAPNLLIQTPQARKRKINLNDLMEALQKALQVENKRRIRKEGERIIRGVELPKVKVDISDLIKNLYSKIKDFFKEHPKVTFTQLLPSQKREDKVLTFIPLLHLENQGKINLHQEKPFGEIEITIDKD